MCSLSFLPALRISLSHHSICFQLIHELCGIPFCPPRFLKLMPFPQMLPWTLNWRRGEGMVIIGEGVGQWGGQGAIMVCGCDGGWYGAGGESPKGVSEMIRVVNHGYGQSYGSKILDRWPVTKVNWEGKQPWSAALGRPPWYVGGHWNSWWRFRPLIPQLKHYKNIILCPNAICVTNAAAPGKCPSTACKGCQTPFYMVGWDVETILCWYRASATA